MSWAHAEAWPHWCGLAQVADTSKPEQVMRIWDGADWTYTSMRAEGASSSTSSDVRAAWSRVAAMAAPDSWAVSWFRSKRDAQPKRVDRSLDALVAALTRRSNAPKDELPLWSPAVFDGSRKKANVVELSCLVLDYDDGTAINAAVKVWGPWAHIIYTTPSHGPDGDRFRVVLPLAQPVAAADWPRVWQWAEQRAGRTVDPACKDASRIYYGHAGDVRYARAMPSTKGRPLLWVDVDRLPAPPPTWKELPRPVSAPVSYDRAVSRTVDLLATCPATRRRAGEMAGAQINDETVKGAKCPRCSQPSVWWPIVPHKIRSAMCHHRKSCGWIGSIYEVIS